MRNGQSVASEKQEEIQSAVQKTDESSEASSNGAVAEQSETEEQTEIEMETEPSESVSIEEQEADLAYDTMEACFYLPIHTSHLK